MRSQAEVEVSVVDGQCWSRRYNNIVLEGDVATYSQPEDMNEEGAGPGPSKRSQILSEVSSLLNEDSGDGSSEVTLPCSPRSEDQLWLFIIVIPET